VHPLCRGGGMGIEGESHAPLKQGEEGAGIEGESRAPEAGTGEIITDISQVCHW